MSQRGRQERREAGDLLREMLKLAKQRVVIVGTNPLTPVLEESGRLLADLLLTEPALTIDILYESDSENFSQSLCAQEASPASRMSYTYLTVHGRRVAGDRVNEGLRRIVGDLLEADGEEAEGTADRLRLRQLNLRLPINIVIADEQVWITPTTHTMPFIQSYQSIPPEHPWHDSVRGLVDFYLDGHEGGKFLSAPGDELIQMYDPQGIPRGIYPRGSFYTTRYMRYSIWGFIFNRKGEILFQRRSDTTKDNRGLWDKSIGGHVDIGDSSTSITAKRELVEELFLPEAEFTKYTRAALGDIIDFGDWLPRKRPERSYGQAFSALAPTDWVMFRATDHKGRPLTVTRTSKRRLNVNGDTVRILPTVFRSDAFFFIAPAGYIDTHEQMKSLVELPERTGAASDHRLASVDQLRRWIEEAEANGRAEATFTDDLLAISLEHSDTLESFSEFVRYAFA